MPYFDLFLPQGNEPEIAKEAARLRIKPIFLYPFGSKKEILNKKEELKELNCYVGTYIIPNNLQSIRRLTKLWLLSDFLVVLNPGKYVRAAVNNPKIDAVFRVPTILGRDFLEYRNSNWNAILTNIAQKNKICYGIDLSQILESDGYPRAKLLGREAQNVRLCYRKIPILLATFAREPWQVKLPENLAAFGRVLGLSAPLSKAAISKSYEDILKKKEARRKPTFVQPGVELVE
jgi:RNase P/RNase MRP subunit p30